MIKVKDLFINNKKFFFDVKEDEYDEFKKYCINNDLYYTDSFDNVYSLNDKWLCTRFMECKNLKDDDNKHSISSMFVSGMAITKLSNYHHYKFSDIKNNRIIRYYKGCCILEKFDIPKSTSYLDSWYTKFVVPVLNNPNDINILFNNIDQNKQITIFYKGTYKQSEELKSFLNTNKNINIVPYGLYIKDNQKHVIREDTKEYVSRFVLDDNGLPRLLEYEEIMDSILVPNDIELDDDTIIKRKVFLDKNKKYPLTQIFVTSNASKNNILKLLNKQNINHAYIITKSGTYNNDSAIKFRTDKGNLFHKFKGVIYHEKLEEKQINDRYLELYL